MCLPEAQNPKFFRIAAFHAQKFSGRSARIHVSRHIKKRVNVSRTYLSLSTKNVNNYHSCSVDRPYSFKTVRTLLKQSEQF